MASFDPFEDMKNGFSDQWQNKTNNLFPAHITVKQEALDNLIEKMPKSFNTNQWIMHRNLCIKRSPKWTNPITGT